MSKAGKHTRYHQAFYKYVGGFNRGHRSRTDVFREGERAREYRQMANEAVRRWNERSEKES